MSLFASVQGFVHRIIRVVSRVYQGLFDKGSSYSAVSALFAGMLAVSLFLQLLDETRTALPQVTIIGGILLCLASLLYIVHKGKAVPKWLGLAAVGLHGLVTAYVLGTAPFLIKAAAVLQELPLMVMYLAWFYPRKTARTAFFIYVVGILGLSSLGSGRYLSESGSTHEIVRLTLFLALCMELGFLWRGHVRAEGQVDPLTGAITREGFSHRALRELQRAQRSGYPLSLAVIDLDGFKHVNDTLGHSAGDEVLRTIVRDIQGSIRSTDTIYRIGGDEFVLLLPRADAASAAKTLARLQSKTSHPWSWGIAEMARHDTPEAMTMRADKNMYKHKRGL